MGKFFTVASPENTAAAPAAADSSLTGSLPDPQAAEAIALLALADAAAYRTPALYILGSPVSRLQLDIAALTLLAVILIISIINLFR